MIRPAAILLTLAVAAGNPAPSTRITLAEVSGAASLPGGRLLLVTRTDGRVALLTGAAERLERGELHPTGEEIRSLAAEGKSPPLEDVEDAAADGAGQVYLAASHGRTALGDAPEERYRLALLRVAADGKVAEVRTTDALLQVIVNQVPFLADAIRRTPARAGLNVEGLAVTGEGHLLVGLRSPTVTESARRAHGGQEDAVVLRIRNPAALFEPSPPPADLGETVKLDLRGQGIRGMAYDPILKVTWLLSGLSPEPNHPVRGPWGLWLWDGRSVPRPAPLPKGLDLHAPDSVCRVEVGGQPRLLLVEGGRSESRCVLLPIPEVK